MRITGFYAAMSALLVLLLAVRVMLQRRASSIGIGDGGDRELLKRIRVHANAIEYLPIALILLLIVELNQTQPMIVHVAGITIVLGRILHASGFSRSSGTSSGRIVGTLLTLLVIIALSLLLLWQYLGSLLLT
ncbi:MAG: MAPEG family protein [Dokdonella sp.]